MLDVSDWPDDIITIDSTLALHSAHERFSAELYALVRKNQAWLQQAMDWPRYVTGEESSRTTLRANYQLHHRGYTRMYLILLQGRIVGVFSFNLIEPTNKAAYIGYWLDRDHQGQGIISRALQAVMATFSAAGTLRRFVIRCIVSNEASNQVALRNGFTLEGRLKEAEYLNGQFHDQNIYGRIVG
ncbi:50S ribosomal protein L7/L12-serine acetyltransferase [Entomohabitans teleogrylli]|uniref:50S ribosomal protein L7/L12-serine acetyltransferase n=1 Tax=Entomohabitans teleogrylli TaxID=1384589 RepID=UPI00073D3B0F|nr:50S ribosomal protein L7/L12-serine acetyltransferase [Entomohabitans teleogrylli]